MDFINIIGTLFDNSIEHVVALAQQIKDLRLNKNQQEINEDVENALQELSDNIDNKINESLEEHKQSIINLENTTNQIREEVNSLEENNTDILRRLSDIEQGNVDIETKDSVPHKFISLQNYNKLSSYDKDTLYIILEGFDQSSSVFGDAFPLILGGPYSHFGEVLPFTLK